MKEEKQTGIKVLSTTSPKEVLNKLAPRFEKASGAAVSIMFVPGSQMDEKALKESSADVLVTSQDAGRVFAANGLAVLDTWLDFALSRGAIAVRAGAVKPKVSSAVEFTSALLAAKSVSFSRGATGTALLKALDLLGIGQQLRSKMVLPAPGELVGAVLARGDAEIGVQQLSELLPIAGIEILGPVPDESQPATAYGACLMTGCRQVETSVAFIQYLRRTEFCAVLENAGFSPIPQT